MSNELIPSFKKSLFDEVIDISADLMELPIDLIIENEVIQNIPVVGTIVKLGKAAVTIRDRHLIKKLVAFIESINNGDIESEELEKHKKILESNTRKLNEELENIIIIIDRQLDIDKTKILGELYKSYISGIIDWEDFKSFSDVLERIFLVDIYQLKKIYGDDSIGKEDSFYPISMSRLDALGLVQYFSGMSVVIKTSNGEQKEIKGQITGYGRIFYEQGIKKLINTGELKFEVID